MRKIWNRPADAVWSLSTQSETGIGNMNICTYVSAVSLDPKLMMVAVYTGTQTLDNCMIGGTVLLQLLTEQLAPVVRVCGQKSGKDINKIDRLAKRYALQQHKGLAYFSDAAGFIELEIEQMVGTTGDHVLLIGKVMHGKNILDAVLLTTSYLKANKYIR